MRWDKRLEQLEGSVSRAISGEPEEYCLKCLGPGGYRILIDRARARIDAAEERGETREVRLDGGGVGAARGQRLPRVPARLATARKHLPLKDVAEAGGWRSTETLLRCYTQADEATMLAVVSETRKVRATGTKL